MAKKLRVAWFSELNTEDSPCASLAAYTSDELLPHLRGEIDLDLFHNSFKQYQDYPTFHYLSASTHHAEKPYDLFFYQLEDRFESNFARQFLGVMPGVTWFHDFLFTTHGPEPILNSPWEEVIKKYNDSSRPWPERGYEFPERERSGIREAGLSFMNLFSSEIAHSEYRRKVELQLIGDPDFFRSAYLPLPVGKPQTKVVGDDPRICLCGSPRIEHRPHKILQALAELDRKIRVLWLLADDEMEQAENLVKEFGLQRVELVGGRTPRKWEELICPADIALHCLFSVYGQTAPYLGISMRQGLPVLVSDFGVADFLPDNLAIKIQPGDTEVTELKAALIKLCSGKVRVSPEESSTFAADVFGSELVAKELIYFLQSSTAELARMRSEWETLEADARSELAEFIVGEPSEIFGSNQAAIPHDIYRELGWT